MKLPIAKFLPKKKTSDYILGLLLRDEKASAVIVEQVDGKIQVIGQHTEYFKSSLEEADTEELLEVLDKTISIAEETLPPDVETKKTVFGVKDEWVIDEKKIKKEHLARLKKVSDSLDLTPMGFLVVSEAVARLIQEEEGAPLSAILAEIGTKSINLVLFRGGKAIDNKQGPIEGSPMETVDALLKYFTVEVLPSRIILFDDKGDHPLIQKFITHQWSKSLPFLHVPQISVLPENFDARSIVFGAATQMGLEVLGEVIEKGASEIKTYEHGEKAALLPADDMTKMPEKTDNDYVKDVPSTPPKSEAAEVQHSAETPGDEPIALSGDNFGFIDDEDIENIRTQNELRQEARTHTPPSHHQQEEEIDDERVQGNKSSPLAVIQEKAAVLLGLIGHLPPVLGKTASMARTVKGNKLLLIPAVALIGLIVLGVLYTSSVRATVTLNLKPKVVEKTEEVTFSPDAVNDFAKRTLTASAISSTLEGTVTTNATGKKEIGEKAKGTVTLYNNNEGKKTLSAGTVLTSSNNLDYVLDKDVSIASQSGDIFTGTKPGTTQATVTAKSIGSDYNLPSNTKFTVSGAANVAAKNDSAFSGGSKKQVTVVSKKDQEKLLSDLPKSLQEKAKEDLGNKVEGDATLLPGFIDTTVATKKFDKNVDDEAKTVTLKGKVTFEGLAYNKKDLQDFATSALKSEYAQNLHISNKGVQVDIKDAQKTDDNEIGADLSIKANLLPTLNTDDIIKRLAGLSKDEAENYLGTLPQVTHSTISLSPPIPFIPQFVPRASDHIKIDVKSDE